MTDHPSGQGLHLLMEAGGALCAVPAHQVGECLRPLQVDPVKGMPGFVQGVSVIRGVPTPVVDLGLVVGNVPIERPMRWVTVKAGDRRVALAVAGVPGVRFLAPADLSGLPPLLRDAKADVVEALGTLDARLLLLLRAGRILPEDAWKRMQLPGVVA
jgi:purine-binding chemotaxis protein CheW